MARRISGRFERNFRGQCPTGRSAKDRYPQPFGRFVTRTSEALDVAARYLLYKLHDLKRVSRAVERGWVVIRNDGNKGRAKAKAKDLWATLTEEGRAVARRMLS